MRVLLIYQGSRVLGPTGCERLDADGSNEIFKYIFDSQSFRPKIKRCSGRLIVKIVAIYTLTTAPNRYAVTNEIAYRYANKKGADGN